MATNELTAAGTPQIDWNAIFEALQDGEDGLRKSKVAYRLAMGVPWEDAAEQTGTTRGAIAGWMKEDQNFRRVVDMIKENLVSFVDSRLHLRVSQADAYADWLLSTIRAPGMSDGIIELPIEKDLKKELLKERGLMARKYLDIAMAGRTKSPTINIGQQNQMNLNLSESAMQLLLRRNIVTQEDDVIDGESETKG
jgi:hypothetical protein